MSKEKVVESIKSIHYGSAGCSMRIKISAYRLLDYISKNSDYEEIINSISKYYNEEYEDAATKIKELEMLLSTCSALLLVGKEYSLEDVGLTAKDYKNKDIINFHKFVDDIKKNSEFKLKLDYSDEIESKYIILSQEKVEESIDEMEIKIQNIEERINKIHFDTISIISIFIAVIFALYGGTKLVSSVVRKVQPCNVDLLIKTAFLLGYILLTFISVVVAALSSYDKKKWRIILIAALNAIYALVVILSLIILK